VNYPVKPQGFEGQKIEVQPAGIFSGYKLIVNGLPAPKGAKRGEMLLRRNDGAEVIASWKPQALGFDVPQLVVDGSAIPLVQPLKWYEWLWGGLPMLLVFAGGALGAVIGFIAFSVNSKIFRAPFSLFLKFLTTAAISMVAVMVYFLIVLLVFG
jgi:hypothetical protein